VTNETLRQKDYYIVLNIGQKHFWLANNAPEVNSQKNFKRYAAADFYSSSGLSYIQDKSQKA